MAGFSIALGSTDLCSFCPQWERHEVQRLVRVGVVVFSSTPPPPSALLEVSGVPVGPSG